MVDAGDEHFFGLPPTGAETYPKHSSLLQLSAENDASKVGPPKYENIEKKFYVFLDFDFSTSRGDSHTG